MSIYLKETTSEEAVHLRKKWGQTAFTFLVDKKGKIVKFLGWNQKDVWNAPLGDGSD